MRKKLKYLIHLKAFNYVDSEGNHVITKEDFTKDDTIEVLEHWLGPNEDWEEEFDNIDLTNKKGEGNVLFRVSDQSFLQANQIHAFMSAITQIMLQFQEFFDWALHKNIDYQGDMGVNLE